MFFESSQKMEEMQINQPEDKDEVVAKIMQSFDIVSKQKRQGLYLENIANVCLSEFGWPEEKTIASLKQAEDLGRIYTTVSNYKQSYRIKNPSNIPCQDGQASMTLPEHHDTNSSTSLDAIQRDFEDFKRFSHAEILSLKAQIAPKSSESPKRAPKDRIEVVQEALIKSLHERIFSLERQLSEKQEIIRKLLENSFEKPLRPTATSSEVHAPMRSPSRNPNRTKKLPRNRRIAQL